MKPHIQYGYIAATKAGHPLKTAYRAGCPIVCLEPAGAKLFGGTPRRVKVTIEDAPPEENNGGRS